MARPLRLELPGGIYHVTARGDERRSIFREAIARAYREYDYRVCEIAGALGCHYATISRRLRATNLPVGPAHDPCDCEIA